MVAKYDYFLFDCDGVLWTGDHELHGAFKALRYIQTFPEKKIFLITNNSTRLRETVIEDKLKRFNFDLPLVNIYTSGYITS